MSKVAMIFGVTGQDGSYLTELLLEKDYRVIGVKRRSSVNTNERLEHITDQNFTIVEGDVTDPSSVYNLLCFHRPDEVYNLSAQSHVATSFEQPALTFQVNAVGVLNVLEGIRNVDKNIRFYQASTSEMFGSNYTSSYVHANDGGFPIAYRDSFQDENTPFAPNSPYAAAKCAAHDLVRVYRDAYGIHASSGILFNHESPRRGELFVTRKITKWLGNFVQWRSKWCPDNINTKDHGDFIEGFTFGSSAGLIEYPLVPKLRLGNLDARRDWGHAKDFVRAMWLMLQKEKADDYVIGTGKAHSIREFLTVAFKEIGIENWEQYVVIDPKFYRPLDVQFLKSNAVKAKQQLGWEPEITFEELVKEMVQNDIGKACQRSRVEGFTQC